MPDKLLKDMNTSKILITLLTVAILFNIPARGQSLRVLFIGDSVTDGGWGRSGGSAKASKDRDLGDWNHIYGHSYMMMCAAELESRYPERPYRFLNRGISGDDIGRLEARWQDDAIANTPDVLSLLEGTNDIHYYLDRPEGDFDMDGWERRYRALLDRSLAANSRLRIVLGTPFVAKAGWVGKADNYRLRDSLVSVMSNRIRQIAEDYDATLVDYNALFARLCDGKSDVSHWIWDGIHPTPAGHRRMADLWLKRTRRLTR